MARSEQSTTTADTGTKGDRLRPGRSDFALAKAATALVAALGPVLVLQQRLWAWITGGPLVWRSSGPTGPEFEGAETAPGVSVHYSDELVWQQTDAGAGQWLIALVPDLLTAAVLATVGVLVLRLLRRVGRGEPFRGASAAHVRAVGTLIFCHGLFMPLVTLVAGVALTFPAQAEPSFGLVVEWGSFVAIAAGLVVLVLSEVWRRGEQLDDDVAGLV